LSFRLKLGIIFIILPLLSSGLYLYVANNVFKKDKTAYVQANAYLEGVNISKRLATDINYSLNLVKSIFKSIPMDELKREKGKKLVDNLASGSSNLYALKVMEFKSTGWQELLKYGDRLDLDIFYEPKGFNSYQIKFKKLEEKQGLTLLFFDSMISLDEKIYFFQVSIHIDVKSLSTNSPYEYFLFDSSKKIYDNKEFLKTNRLLSHVESKISKLFNNNSGSLSSSFFLGDEDNFIATLNSITNDLYILTLIDSTSIDAALSDLFQKSLLFIVLVILYAMMISIFLSSFLSKDISALVKFSDRIVADKFNSKLGKLSQKEFQVLGKAFNKMVRDIKDLFIRLEKYNLELEDKVKERTSQLNESLVVQKAMTDNLEDAFMVLNKNGELTSTFSNKSFEFFENLNEQNHITNLLGMDIGKEEFKDIVEHVENGTFDFSQLVEFFPARLNIKESILDIKYGKLMIDNQFKGIVLVATDKTKEVESKKQFEIEKEKVNFVLKSISNKALVKNFIREIEVYIEDLKSAKSHKELFRITHSIKGASSSINIKTVADYCHEIEDYLDSRDNFSSELSINIHNNINLIFQKFKASNIKLWNILFKVDSVETIEVDVKYLKEFLHSWPKTEKETYLYLTHKKVPDIFTTFEHNLNLCAEELQIPKPIVNYSYNFKNLPFDILDSLNLQLVHYARNIVAHGYDKNDRSLNNKDDRLSVLIDVLFESSKVTIKIKDDGKGIDPNQLVSKAIEEGILKEKNTQILSNQEKLNLVFSDGVSTAKNVSSFSGRGVGMSSLKSEIEKLGGRIHITSKLNLGTELIIELKYSV
jgi:HPt (histidine-containing phosphotransfer) domain-containing protein